MSLCRVYRHDGEKASFAFYARQIDNEWYVGLTHLARQTGKYPRLLFRAFERLLSPKSRVVLQQQQGLLTIRGAELAAKREKLSCLEIWIPLYWAEAAYELTTQLQVKKVSFLEGDSKARYLIFLTVLGEEGISWCDFLASLQNSYVVQPQSYPHD